jgi:hypothetical protein
MNLLVGAEFAGHRIEGVAGRGGMGVVYRATDLRLKRTVALKLIASELSDDDEFRLRFQRESQLAASIRHPNVITIFAAGEEQGQLFLTMEYIEGTDLRETIAVHGRLGPELASGLVLQVAAALDAAHARGLVHRDVKPANVLIAGADGRRQAYLTDFGLTKQATSRSEITQTGMVIGTMDYIAPEQLQGTQVDGRADVYALGCVLYEILAGQVPFPRDSEAARMWAHMSEPPPSVRTFAPSLPAQLDEVLRRAMAKDPEQRFPSAGDLGRAAVAAAHGATPSSSERSVGVGVAAPQSESTLVLPQGGPPGAGTEPRVPGPTRFEPLPAPATPARPGAPIAPPPPEGAPARLRVLIAAVAAGVLLAILVVVAAAGVFGGDGGENSAGKVAGAPIRAGVSPTSIAFGAGSIWVGQRRTVLRVDPATGEARTLKPGGAPSNVEFGEGGLWTWNYSNSVTRIDPDTDVEDDYVQTGADIGGFAVGEGGVWVIQPKQGTVTFVDAKTDKAGSPIRVPGDLDQLAAGGGAVWVSRTDSTTIAVIDPRSKKVDDDAVRLGKKTGGLFVRDQVLYVGTRNDVSRVDTVSGVVGKAFTDPPGASGAAVGAGSLWRSFPIERTVDRTDLKSGKRIGAPIKVPIRPDSLAFGLGKLWAVDSKAGRMVAIEP